MSFGTEQEFPLSHVFLFAISGYMKIGLFDFRIEKFNTLRDKNCGCWFGLCHSVYLAPDSETLCRYLLTYVIALLDGNCWRRMLCYNERSSSRVEIPLENK